MHTAPLAAARSTVGAQRVVEVVLAAPPGHVRLAVPGLGLDPELLGAAELAFGALICTPPGPRIRRSVEVGVTGRFVVVPAAYLMLRRGAGSGEVLLQLRQGTGYMDGFWAMAAAGHVEQGESVFEAAQREAVEELGVEIDTTDLDPLCSMHRTGATGLPIDERVDVFFECRRWRGEPRLLEPEKAADLRWFRLDALPNSVVPHELFVLERVRAGELAAVVTFGF